MHLFLQLLDLVRNLDVRMLDWVDQFQGLTYFMLAAILFCETGLVVTPFLPGDSLLFAAGAAVGSRGTLSIWVLILILMSAAILGDNVNYLFGKFLGQRVFRRDFWFLKRSYVDRTQAFYDRHGGKTLIIARFVPIVRTFAPFVAGVGRMQYRRFIVFCLIGCAAWVPTLSLAGYYFGGLPIVRNNFELVIFAIIGISLLPMIVEWLRHRQRSKQLALLDAADLPDQR